MAARIKAAGVLNITFSTLNHELVLEMEISHLGRSIDYFDPGAGSGVPVLKLHGSCNFFVHGISVAPSGVTFTSGATFHGSGLKALSTQWEIYQELNGSGLPPAMCMYMSEKRAQVAPGVIEALQAEWARAAEQADVVAVVGVHPNPGDVHLWEVLARVPGQLVYIGNRKAFQTWAAAYRGRRKRRALAPRFDAGMDKLVEWLANW